MKYGPCHGLHDDSVYSGIEPKPLDSPWLVKHAVGLPSPSRARINYDWLIIRHTTENKCEITWFVYLPAPMFSHSREMR